MLNLSYDEKIQVIRTRLEAHNVYSYLGVEGLKEIIDALVEIREQQIHGIQMEVSKLKLEAEKRGNYAICQTRLTRPAFVGRH